MTHKYVLNSGIYAPAERQNFIISGYTPDTNLRHYDFYTCDNIPNYVRLHTKDGISKYQASVDRDFLVTLGGKSNCIFSSFTPKHSGIPLWTVQITETPWDFCLDRQNDVYIATKNSLIKLCEKTGEKLWAAPFDLSLESNVMYVSLVALDFFLVLSYVKRDLGQICVSIFDFETGRQESFPAYQINMISQPYLPIPIPTTYYCNNHLWRLIRDGRETIIKRLNLASGEWSTLGSSSIWLPNKFFPYTDDSAIVVGSPDNPLIEKVSEGKKQLLFSNGKAERFDCILSSQNKLGVYTQNKSGSRFYCLE